MMCDESRKRDQILYDRLFLENENKLIVNLQFIRRPESFITFSISVSKSRRKNTYCKSSESYAPKTNLLEVSVINGVLVRICIWHMPSNSKLLRQN